jgi:serine/threonine protein kinase
MLQDELLKHGYQVQTEIGKGSNAITYRAHSLQTNQEVAIKVISLRQVRDWKIIELFEREAKVLASLNHPHIPKYIDYLTIDTTTDRFFVMIQELAIGQSLQNLYEQGWRPEEREIKHIAMQLMEILAYLHNLNPPVIHRDIKPANVIYQPDEQKVFLVDFGAVQDVYRNTFSHGRTFVGTMGFIAPEQYSGSISFASDLYSLGATIVYLITGMNPADIPQSRLRIDWRRVKMIEISDDFGEWIDTLLEPIPEDRGSSSADVLQLLKGKKQDYLGLRTNSSPLSYLEWNVKKNRDRLEIVATFKKLDLGRMILDSIGLTVNSIPDGVGTLLGIFFPIFLVLFFVLAPFLYLVILSVLILVAINFAKLLVYRGKIYFEVRVEKEKFILFHRGRRKKYVFDKDQISAITWKAYYVGIISLIIFHGVNQYEIFPDNVLGAHDLKKVAEIINDYLGLLK